MKLRYADATIKQLAKAKAKSPYLINRFNEGNNYKEILTTLKKEDSAMFGAYKSYDRWGRLTIVGKELRKYQLKLQKLSENATIEEFFQKQAEKNRKMVLAVVKKVKKHFDGSYGPQK